MIVVGRGGGSMEDLWEFNEECLARAIYRSAIPVVSAVGHERDVTISDLVADARAMTPTQVGGLVVPDERELLQRLEDFRESLAMSLTHLYERARDRLALAARHPVFLRPETLVEPLERRLADGIAGLGTAIEETAVRASERLQRAGIALEAMSPLGVLGRGYSITLAENGKILTDVSCLEVGDIIETVLARGRVRSTATELRPPEGSRDG